MPRSFSLAHLTAIVLSPPELIHVAARAGYQSVGLRLIAVTPDSPGYPLMDDPAAMRATKAAIADTGVGVMDIEFIRITPETDVNALEPFVAAGAELGAKYVITAPYDPDHRRLSDRLGAISDLCGGYGIQAVLEFFPWTDVPDLATAAQVVEATGREHCGILVDTLHYARGASAPEHFDGLAPSRFPFVHVCDAPAGTSWTREELFHAGRIERLPPGEGGIDIRTILQHLPPDIPVGLEVPMTAMMAAKGAEAVARRARQAAERLLAC
ncbi:MAG: sugar phosphate isomerase/epimerase family protein [Janthinobacterium lividum]